METAINTLIFIIVKFFIPSILSVAGTTFILKGIKQDMIKRIYLNAPDFFIAKASGELTTEKYDEILTEDMKKSFLDIYKLYTWSKSKKIEPSP